MDKKTKLFEEITGAIPKIMPTKEHTMFAWNITKCKSFHISGKRKGKVYYKFWIIDYDVPDIDKLHILEMRNRGLVKTKYFYTKKEAMKFLHEYQDGRIK